MTAIVPDRAPGVTTPSEWAVRRSAIKRLRGLTPLERLVLHELNDWTGADQQEKPWVVYRSNENLARDLEVSRSSVTRAIQRLETFGCLYVVEPKRHHRAARYHVTVTDADCDSVVHTRTTNNVRTNTTEAVQMQSSVVHEAAVSGANPAVQWCTGAQDLCTEYQTEIPTEYQTASAEDRACGNEAESNSVVHPCTTDNRTGTEPSSSDQQHWFCPDCGWFGVDHQRHASETRHVTRRATKEEFFDAIKVAMRRPMKPAAKRTA